MNKPNNNIAQNSTQCESLLLVLTVVSTLISCSQDKSNELEKKNKIMNKSTNYLEIITGSDLGLNFKHDANFSDNFSIYEPLGSGVAALDYDNDGDMDLFIPQYGSSKKFSKLYKNDNGHFSDVTASSGLDGLDQLVFASTADFNNDGFVDLLVGGNNKLSLLINNAGMSFKSSKLITPEKGQQFYTSASWFDMNRDGYLDVWVTNYVDDSIESFCQSANGDRDYCPPKSYPALADNLFINENGQSFRSHTISNELGIKSPGLGVVSDDFDNNGWTDVYVANDGVANQLFYNFDGKLTTDSAKLNGVAFNLMGNSEASMGVAIADVDNNNYSDLYVTHFKGETNTFYLNNNGVFSDSTAFFKLVKNVRPVTGFGTLLIDYNADNSVDIITVNGSTQYKKSLSNNDRLVGEPIQFWANNRELKFNFDTAINSSNELRVGRGLSSIDIDNDGDYDFIINNNNQELNVVLNQYNPIKWFGLTLRCQNRVDYGAKIKFSNLPNTNHLYRASHTDGSYASSIDPRILIYNLNQYDTFIVKWSHSQTSTKYLIDDFNKNKYNIINCPEKPK